MQYRLYEDSHGKKQQEFGVSIWPTEFCLAFGIQTWLGTLDVDWGKS